MVVIGTQVLAVEQWVFGLGKSVDVILGRVLRRTLRAQIRSNHGTQWVTGCYWGQPQGLSLSSLQWLFQSELRVSKCYHLYIPRKLVYIPSVFSGDLSVSFSLKCYSLKTSPDASDISYMRKPLETGYYEHSLLWCYSFPLKIGSQHCHFLLQLMWSPFLTSGFYFIFFSTLY